MSSDEQKNKNGCCGEDVSSPCITVQPSASQVSEGLVLQGCKDPTTLSSALDNGRPDDHGSSPRGGLFAFSFWVETRVGGGRGGASGLPHPDRGAKVGDPVQNPNMDFELLVCVVGRLLCSCEVLVSTH